MIPNVTQVKTYSVEHPEIYLQTVPSLKYLNSVPKTETAFLSKAHGFLPSKPLPPLPAPYSIWVDLAKQLSTVAESDTWQSFLSTIPTISAENLPTTHLLRANLTLGTLAHSIQNVGQLPVPSRILSPWAEVARRLERPIPSLTAFDLLCYNIDPSLPTPTPSVMLTGSSTEASFITQTHAFEKAAASLPEIVAQTQQAALHFNISELPQLLTRLTYTIQTLTSVFQSTSPQSNSPFHMDHVEWGRAIDVHTTPVSKGETTGSGLLLPSIHLLDLFFSRKHYHTPMGRLALKDRSTMHDLHRGFFEAVGKVSVYDRIQTFPEPVRSQLAHLFRQALAAFASESGFLGKHRLRLAGYLEMSFKVGRKSTGSGMQAGPHWTARVWRRALHAMSEAMTERLNGVLDWHHGVVVTDLSRLPGAEDVFAMTVNTGGALLYQPGDHFSVLVENRAELVNEILSALHMQWETEITVREKAWLESLANRGVIELQDSAGDRKQSATVSARCFFKYAHLRPSIADLSSLRQVSGSLDSVIQPLAPRFYSVASHMADSPTSVSIVFSRVQYSVPAPNAKRTPLSERPMNIPLFLEQKSQLDLHGRTGQMTNSENLHGKTFASPFPKAVKRRITVHGASSSYLSGLRVGDVISARIVPELGFRLPKDPKVPIIMICLGLGVTPFLSFLKELTIRNKNRSLSSEERSWLILGVKSQHSIPFLQDIETAACKDKIINVSMAVSREDVELDENASGDKLVFREGRRKRIPEMIQRNDAFLQRLWNVIQKGGHIYACGKPELEPMTRELITHAAEKFEVSSEGEEKSPQKLISQLAGEGRLHFDCYNSGKPVVLEKTFSPADVAVHSSSSSCWVVFRENVYDITEYLHIHPGGPKILLDKAGRDMTADFEAAHGTENFRIEAMLEPYKIGRIQGFPSNLTFANVMKDLSIPVLEGVLERRSIFLLDRNTFPELHEQESFLKWKSHHSSDRYVMVLYEKFLEMYEPEMFSFVMKKVTGWLESNSEFGSAGDVRALTTGMERKRSELLRIARQGKKDVSRAEMLAYLQRCAGFLYKWVEFATKLQRIVESGSNTAIEENGKNGESLRMSIIQHVQKGISVVYEELPGLEKNGS